MEILKEYESAKSLFDTDFAEPVQEVLGQRNRSQYVTPQNPLINIFNPVPISQSNITDEQIAANAKAKVQSRLFRMKIYMGLLTGGVSAVSFNKTDKERLEELKKNNETDSIEYSNLIDLQDLAKKCENQNFANEEQMTNFLIMVKTEEMKRDRAAGVLKFDSFDDYCKEMLAAQVAALFGSNPKLIPIVAVKGYSSIRSFKLF
jgi:hypothetical protein